MNGTNTVVEVGGVRVKLLCFDPDLIAHCDDYIARMAGRRPANVRLGTYIGDLDLILVPPVDGARRSYPTWVSDDVREMSDLCHRAWAGIAGNDAARQNPRVVGSLLEDWRQLSEKLEHAVPGTGLYRCNGTARGRFVSFQPGSFRGSRHRSWLSRLHIHGAVLGVAEVSHLRSGAILRLHAAGVVTGKNAFLFLGPSGAGKSTAADLSAHLGWRIVHDDMLSVIQAGDAQYVLSSVGTSDRRRMRKPFYRWFLEASECPLRAVFWLIQDSRDCLVPIPQSAATEHLFSQCFDALTRTANTDLAGMLFMACVRLAEHVPMFELHFRKTSDFCEVIVDRFRT